MNKLTFVRRASLAFVFACSCVLTEGQSTSDTTARSVDSLMRSNEKIYVVMAVCLTILAVLFLYLIRIDMKVSKKEKSA